MLSKPLHKSTGSSRKWPRYHKAPGSREDEPAFNDTDQPQNNRPPLNMVKLLKRVFIFLNAHATMEYNWSQWRCWTMICPRLHFYQTISAWSVDQGSSRKCSAVRNFAPVVTKFCVMWEGLSSHMTQNLVTVGAELLIGEWLSIDPWFTDQADMVWYITKHPDEVRQLVFVKNIAAH